MKFKKSTNKGKAEMDGVIIGSGRSFKPTKKTALIILGIVVVVVALSIVIPKFRTNNSSAKQGDACSSNEELLKEARGFFEPEAYQRLQLISDKIKLLKDFEQDPNCLYIVTTYYANISDASFTEEYVKKFEAVYEPNIGLSETLGVDSKDVEMLRKRAATVDKIKEEAKSNATFY